MNITVLGAGAWGTALAVQACERHPVCLWARDAEQLDAMSSQRRNARYLNEVDLPASLQLSADLAAALAHAADGLIVVATPMAGLSDMLQAIRRLADSGTPLVWLCKGFAQDSGELAHEVAAKLLPDRPSGVLSGPSFAIEVARGRPTARAALITRGLAEMTRLGVALGARAETFMGLSGLGDLVLTATGSLSRNRRVGLGLAQGQPLAAILGELGHVAEGVLCAPMVLRRADSLGVEMPITQAVVDVIEGRLSAVKAVGALMARDARSE